MASPFLQGFQVGSGVALQRQQLQSQAAYRRLQEQQIAQAMALKMQENALQNQFRAEMATAMQAFQDVTAEQIMVPMEGQEGLGGMNAPLMPVKNPNPMRKIDAAMQTIVPVVAKYQPDKVGSVVNNLLVNEVRERELGVREKALTTARPRTPEQIEADKALTKQREASADLSKARTKAVEEGKATHTPANVQKIFEFAEKEGVVFSPEQKREILEIEVGLKPKAGTERAIAPRNVWVSQQFQIARQNSPRATTDEQLVASLEKVYDRIVAMPSESTPQGRPKVGDVIKGYRYNGKFPPSDRRSWDKVQ